MRRLLPLLLVLLCCSPLWAAEMSWVHPTIPDCQDTGGAHLNYIASTNTFSCGSSGSGAGGGDITAVGSCATGACFTSGSPSASLVLNNATSGTITLQATTGALGTRTQSFPAKDGDIAISTGTLTSGNCAKFDASGRIVDNGSACNAASGLADSGANGVVVRTALGVTTARTLTGTTAQVTVTDGNGVSGNPTFSLPQNIDTAAAVQFGRLGLGVSAPGTAGMYAATAGANNVSMMVLKRNTDTSPTGNFLTLQDAAGGSLWNIDITGSLSAGTVPGARVSGNISGNAGAATALAANPTDCGANTYATAIDAGGNLTCGQVSLTAGVTGILPGANGGTGNGFFAVSGPATALRTFAFPNADATVLTTNAAVTSAQGGTGANNTATSGRYLKGDGSNFVTSSGSASGVGSCANQVVTALSSDAAPTCTSLTTAYLPSAGKTRTCMIHVGVDNGPVLTDADLGPQLHQCRVDVTSTVQEIAVYADGGTPSVVVQKRTGSTATALLSSALATAGSGAIACAKTSAVTGLDGATTCSATLQNNTAIPAGYTFGLTSGTAGGTAKRMTVAITFTAD